MTRTGEIRARLAAATKGPWHDMVMGSEGSTVFNDGENIYTSRRIARCPEFEDAEFIAHAPEDMEYLLDNLASMQEGWRLMTRHIADTSLELDRVQAGIRALHRSDEFDSQNSGVPQCVECIEYWPCETYKLLGDN